MRRSPRPVDAAWCDECQKQVQWLSLTETVRFGGYSEREICRQIETREIHFLETEEGYLMICRDSLSALYRKLKDNLIFPENIF